VLGQPQGMSLLLCLPNCWLEVSVCIREVLRPATSTQVLVVFLCLQANAEMVPKFRATTVCFSCRPPPRPYLTSSKLSSLAVEVSPYYLSKLRNPEFNEIIRIRRPLSAVFHKTYYVPRINTSVSPANLHPTNFSTITITYHPGLVQ
jgi:hypothetical protein